MSYQFKKFRPMHFQLVLRHWQEPWVSQHDLAQAFGLTDAWCSQILASAEAKALMSQLGESNVDTVLSVQAQFQAIAPQAAKELGEMALDRSGLVPQAIKARALSTVLQMAGHTPVRKVELSHRPPTDNEWQRLSDLQVRERLLKIVATSSPSQSQGDPTQGDPTDPDKGPDGSLIN